MDHRQFVLRALGVPDAIADTPNGLRAGAFMLAEKANLESKNFDDQRSFRWHVGGWSEPLVDSLIELARSGELAEYVMVGRRDGKPPSALTNQLIASARARLNPGLEGEWVFAMASLGIQRVAAFIDRYPFGIDAPARKPEGGQPARPS